MNEMTALILGTTIGVSMMASVALHHWFLARSSIHDDLTFDDDKFNDSKQRPAPPNPV